MKPKTKLVIQESTDESNNSKDDEFGELSGTSQDIENKSKQSQSTQENELHDTSDEMDAETEKFSQNTDKNELNVDSFEETDKKTG
jgi:uncharacterized damage-inducible protein DinB